MKIKCEKTQKLSSRKSGVKKSLVKRGKGFIDRVIDKLPFELHIPSYQYCGPGTKLEKRLARGDPGINPLDAACKEHDIAYSKHKSSEERYLADEKLMKESLKRAFAKDSSFPERASALAISAAMKAKTSLTKMGAGLKRRSNLKKKKKGKCSKKKGKQLSFASLIKNAKVAIKSSKPENVDSAIKVAVDSIKKSKRGKRIKTPRTIKLPTFSGGVLPLIPIFAGLGALGSIVGSATGIVKAIRQVKNAQQQMEENKRHNQTMEEIAIRNKSGRGFYLRPSKKGNGFYLAPYAKNR